MKVDLNGSRVLVLGGSGVLGGLIASELLSRDARVMLAGRDKARLESTAQELGGVPTASLDLRDYLSGWTVVEAASNELGGLDGVVNAAGVVAFGRLADLTDETLDELVATDFTGPLRVMRAALSRLDGGYFVNITGVVAEQPVAGMAAYSAVKAGLSAASRALARELRREGVHVLDARPPHTETGLAARPIAGDAPPMSDGLAPSLVARVIVDGLAAGKRELAAADFAA